MLLRPFAPPKDVNKYGPARLVQRMGLEQSEHDKQPCIYELQGFGADTTTMPTAKDVFNVLVTAGQTYLETEKAKTEAEKLQAQAAATQAATDLQTARAGIGTAAPWVLGLLAVGAFLTIGRRKK